MLFTLNPSAIFLKNGSVFSSWDAVVWLIQVSIVVYLKVTFFIPWFLKEN